MMRAALSRGCCGKQYGRAVIAKQLHKARCAICVQMLRHLNTGYEIERARQPATGSAELRADMLLTLARILLAR